MMLNLSLFCKSGICSTLWPVDTSYRISIYNHMSNSEDITPADIFTRTKFTNNKIKDIHVCGYPVYVLNPVLQQGHKILKWNP